MRMAEEKHDAEEVKEILEVVSEKIPALLNALTDVLYGKESAAKYGQAIAGFYKSLKDSGMTDQQAYELTKTYMSSLDLAGIIGKAVSGGGKHEHEDEGDDIGKEIEERVKQRIRSKFDEEK
jgi:hypothetical protein